MNRYIGKETIINCADFFRSHSYKKPEQIGLFFYFKAKGLNDLLYSKYDKWGDTPPHERRENLRILYDLAGMFDVASETGSKRSALFPFSICPDIKANAFYNGATPFSNLISRISDTLDNALVSTFIKRNTATANEIKLQNGYVDLLKNEYLLGAKIPLEFFAAWCYKFWKIEMPVGSTDQDLRDVCVLSFLLDYFISVKEFQSMFFYGSKAVISSDRIISGDELRKCIKFGRDIFPEIASEPSPTIPPFNMVVSEDRVKKLLEMRNGESLTSERIVQILSERDTKLQNEYNNMKADDTMPEAEIVVEPVLPEYDINQLGRILFSMYNGSENKSTAVHMFGIKYGAIIRKNSLTSIAIVSASGINSSYQAEVDKGIRIYESILNNEYGIKFFDGDLSGTTRPIPFPAFQKRDRTKYPLNCILYGAPGTGKTYATAQYALAITENKDLKDITAEARPVLMERYNKLVEEGQIVFTTFHQNYGYEDFIQGIRPDTSAKEMSFKTVDGVFKVIADNALKHPEKDYVLIIDEINRANISKVFGELITLIENDKRWGEENAISATLPSGESFVVPNNLYIVGTMNSADKSISLIDTALRRRFEFVEYVPNLSLIPDEKLRNVLDRLNNGIAKELDSTDLLIGHSFFMNRTIDDLCDVMNHSIIPLLYEYFFDNQKKVEAQIKNAIEGMNVEIKSGSMGRIRLVKKES